MLDENSLEIVAIRIYHKRSVISFFISPKPRGTIAFPATCYGRRVKGPHSVLALCNESDMDSA